MSVLTYRQMQSMNYSFALGSFQPNNFSLEILSQLTPDPDASEISQNMSGLLAISWQEFTEFVDTTLKDKNENLFIAMYSNEECKDDQNRTEIYDCFDNWWEANNGSTAPEYFIYTELNDPIFVDVNSIHASDVLDGPRDVFMFIIMMFCFIWFFLGMFYLMFMTKV